MKENRIHTMFRLGIVLVFALILGLSSFFADQSTAVYAGEPETVAENTETADELTGGTEAVTEETTETVSDTQETEEASGSFLWRSYIYCQWQNGDKTGMETV